MSECDFVRHAIDEAALGGELSETCRAHLATCVDCAEMLEQRLALVQRIDASLRAGMAAQPSEAAIDRVLAHVRSAPRTRTIAASGRLWAALAAGLAAIALALHFAAPPASHPTEITAWHSPTASLLEPSR
jgi:anti-sigma factor RsiW